MQYAEKHGSAYYMSAWSKEEVLAVRSRLHPEIEEAEVLRRYEALGGKLALLFGATQGKMDVEAMMRDAVKNVTYEDFFDCVCNQIKESTKVC